MCCFFQCKINATFLLCYWNKFSSERLMLYLDFVVGKILAFKMDFFFCYIHAIFLLWCFSTLVFKNLSFECGLYGFFFSAFLFLFKKS